MRGGVMQINVVSTVHHQLTIYALTLLSVS